MTTIKEIVDIFLVSKGMTSKGGSDNDISPILQLIIMDSALTIYKRYIRTVECRFKMRKLQNEWSRLYKTFNDEYFLLYDKEQTDFIIEFMDDFEKYIDKHLKIAFIQVENLVINEPLERQEVIAAAILVSVLTQSAQIVYDGLYAKAGIEHKHQVLERMQQVIYEWQNLYYGKGKPDVNPNNDKNTVLAVDILCKNMVYFLETYTKNETV